MSEPVRQVSVEEVEGAVVIRIHVRLAEEATAQQLLQTIDAIPAPSATPAFPAMQSGKIVILDLSGVEFLPTLCLGALVEAQKRCRQRSRTLKLAGVRPPIRRLLTVTDLETTFDLCESVAQALGA